MDELKQKIKNLLDEKRITSAEEWADIAGELVLFKGTILKNRRIAEMAANRKLKEMRAWKDTKADADIEWKATDEYEAWQNTEDTRDEFESLERIARKEAEIRKKSNY